MTRSPFLAALGSEAPPADRAKDMDLYGLLMRSVTPARSPDQVGGGVQALTTRKIVTTLRDCWDFIALACHLGGGQGGYSGPSRSTPDRKPGRHIRFS